MINSIIEENSDDDFTEENDIEKCKTVEIKTLENQLAQLEKLIIKYNDCAMSVEEMESEESQYMKQDSIIKNYLQLWKEYRRMTKVNTGNHNIFRSIKITKSRYDQINSKIKSHLSKKRKFPDYTEIRRIFVDSNNELGLNLNESTIDFESLEAFTEICNQLQFNRKEYFKENIQLLTENNLNLTSLQDPAECEIDLNMKLENIYKKQKEKFDRILKKFTLKCQKNSNILKQ